MVTGCFIPSKGGIEKSVSRLIDQLLKHDDRICVITSSRGLPPSFYHENMNGVDVIRYPEKRFLFDCPVNPRIALHLLKTEYDILHVHGVTPTISDLAIIFGKIKRKPIIFTYHSSPIPDFGGRCGRTLSKLHNVVFQLLIKLVDRVTVATWSYAKRNPNLKHVLDKVTVIPWGVDVPKPQNPFDDQTNKKITNILFVGQLKRYKGVRYLIKSIKLLSEKNGSQLHLTIVGEGPERGPLEAYAKRIGVRATFTGIVSDELLSKYYSEAGIFVLPSITRESFGLVILEAMSYGKPVIATDIPGPNEIVKDGFNGILVPPKKAYALTEAVETLITDSKLFKSLSINAKKTAENYSWSKVGDRYEDVYRQAVEKPTF